MKYIVYLTTNQVNKKIYVGVHKTENPSKFDGYLGCGVNRNNPSSIFNAKTPFCFAVKKYGFDSFIRTTIKEFDSEIEALDLEAEIVNEEFIKREDTYNIALGGGLPPLLNKVIYQYDLNGNYVKQWNSIVEASKYYNISESSIGKAVNFKRTSCNFLWSNCKFDKLDLKKYNIYSPEILVYIYNSDGTYLLSHDSMSECAKYLNVPLSNIQRGIKIGTMIKGYYVSDKLYTIYKKPEQTKMTGLIHQYNLNGEYIKTFNSISEVEKEFNEKMNGINNAIRIGTSYYKGFLWHRGDKLNELTPYKNKSKAQKIGQYTMDDVLIKTFNTVREARKEFPNVSKVLNGSAKHCHNFKFKYIN